MYTVASVWYKYMMGALSCEHVLVLQNVHKQVAASEIINEYCNNLINVHVSVSN